MFLMPYVYAVVVLWVVLFNPQLLYTVSFSLPDWLQKLVFLSLATGIWSALALRSLKPQNW